MVSGLILAATSFVGCFHNGPVDASGDQAEAKPDLDAWRVDRRANASAKGPSAGDVLLHPKGRKGGAEPR